MPHELSEQDNRVLQMVAGQGLRDRVNGERTPHVLVTEGAWLMGEAR